MSGVDPYLITSPSCKKSGLSFLIFSNSSSVNNTGCCLALEEHIREYDKNLPSGLCITNAVGSCSSILLTNGLELFFKGMPSIFLTFSFSASFITSFCTFTDFFPFFFCTGILICTGDDSNTIFSSNTGATSIGFIGSFTGLGTGLGLSSLKSERDFSD